MSAVEKGLPLRSLDRVVHAVAPSDTKFAFQIIPRATLARRRKAWATAKDPVGGRLSAEEGARLTRLASVWAMALEVWGTEEAARQFMFETHGLLHGRRPVDIVLENELGRPIVEGILGRLRYGSAV
jgi:putative toxin-antitoxin system antitoxin component (TIGR02293 family)